LEEGRLISQAPFFCPKRPADRSSAWISNRPSRACRARFVASSVTTMATSPRAFSSKPIASAIRVATRRASPAWLASETGIATCGVSVTSTG